MNHARSPTGDRNIAHRRSQNQQIRRNITHADRRKSVKRSKALIISAAC
jgi:hypothetical protein